jgi:hypothetical protein
VSVCHPFPDGGRPESLQQVISTVAGQWTQVTVPLSALGNPSAIKLVTVQENSGAAQPTFFVDEISLVR